MNNLFNQSTPGDDEKQPQTSEFQPRHSTPQTTLGPSPASATAPDRVSPGGDDRMKALNQELDGHGKAADRDFLANHIGFLDNYSEVIRLLYEAPYGLSDNELLVSIAQVSDQPRPDQVRDRMVREVIISRTVSNQSRYSLTFNLRKFFDQTTGMNTHGLQQVRQVALSFYRKDQSAVEQFLTQPHPMLEDRAPLSVALEDEGGFRRVIKVLEGAARVHR